MFTSVVFAAPFILSMTGVFSNDHWTPQNFPDPTTEPGKCGRYAGKPAFVCDPENILPVKGADNLDWLLSGIYYNDTKCPCSAYQCERTKTRNRGYIINIAVIPRLSVQQGERNREALVTAAFKFAHALATIHWTKGACDNDIVIVYSYEDETVYSIAGSATRMRLSQEVMADITNRHAYQFSKDRNPYAGLYGLVLDFRNALRGEYVSWRERDLSQQPKGSGNQTRLSVTLLFFIIILVL